MEIYMYLTAIAPQRLTLTLPTRNPESLIPPPPGYLGLSQTFNSACVCIFWIIR